MADKDTPEFSREEAQGFLFNGGPRQVVAAPVMQTTPSIPVPPPVSVKSVERGAPVAKQPDSLSLVSKVTEANKQLQASVETPKPPSAMHGLVEELSNNWKPIAVGALAAGATYGAARLLGGRKSAETPATKQPTQPAAQRIEPTFATPEETAAFKPIDQLSAPSKLAVESEAKFGVPLSDVENHFGVKVTNIKDAEILSNNYKNSLPGAIGNAPSGVPGANPMDQLTTQPPAPQLMQPKPPAGAVAPQSMATPPAAPVSVSEAVAGGVNPTQAVTQTIAQEIDAAPTELRTGTGKIAYAGQGPATTISKRTGQPQFKKEYALEDIPKGFALVPGGQYIDPLRQDLGQIEYKKAFTGRDFPQTYEEAIAAGKDINRSLGRATREEAKAAGLPYGEITPGITQKTTENKKLVKIIGKAGLAGALVSLADLALAKTPEEKANAGLGLLGAILPPGMDVNAAGAPGVPQSQVSNAYLLGSPFAQSEAAKAYRLREKAGAGRGVAPPSAYQR